MHPIALITVDGVPISNLLPVGAKLIMVQVTDHEGEQADQISIEIEAGTPIIAAPRKKAKIECSMGFAEIGVDFMGSFEAHDIEKEVLPWRIRINGKAADMSGTAKQHRDKHYDEQTLGQIYRTIAGRNGWSAQIDPALASIMPRDGQGNGYVAQIGESDLHFAPRLARRYGGLATVKNGRLIVQKQGSGKSPGGADMPVVVLTREQIKQGTTRIQWGDREKHKKVKAHHHNHKTGERETYEAEAQPDGEADFTLRHSYGSADEARAAADAKANDLGRNADYAATTVVGNPWIKAGCPLQFAIGDPDADTQSFIIQNAIHVISVQQRAYTTAIQARNPDKAPGKGGKFAGPKTIGGAPKSSLGR